MQCWPMASASASATPLKAGAPRPLSLSSSAEQLGVPLSASAATSAQHSPAYHAMLQSPLASTHSKFPLPGDPGYVKPYVFLGGSCDPTTWRADIAVPRFIKANIPFFNPQVKRKKGQQCSSSQEEMIYEPDAAPFRLSRW